MGSEQDTDQPDSEQATHQRDEDQPGSGRDSDEPVDLSEVRKDDGQEYLDRDKLDFDPDDGLYSGTAVDGTSEIPGPHDKEGDEDSIVEQAKEMSDDDHGPVPVSDSQPGPKDKNSEDSES
jgi:hypothetical protein